MEMVGWIVALLAGGLAAYLALRPEKSPYREAVSRLISDLNDSGPLPEGSPDDPPEVARLRAELRRRVAPARASGASSADPQERALRGLFRYVDRAVLRPLERAVGSEPSSLELRDAVDALRDLAFYAEETADGTEPPQKQNLQSVVQSVTREFTLETGTPVSFSGPGPAIPVSVVAERFKDALFLLLANAGHFGGGETIEVTVDPKGDEVEVRIRDRGPGFTEEALKRAFEPFWTSESDALGLGLHRSKELLEGQGASVRVGNPPGGGAEAAVTLPRAR